MLDTRPTHPLSWLLVTPPTISFFSLPILLVSLSENAPTNPPAVSYAILFHEHEIMSGMRMAWRSIRRRAPGAEEEEDLLTQDVHQRIQSNHKEVPEWVYFLTLCVAAGIGMAGIGAFNTFTTPAVVLFGIILCAIFVIPIGLINAITGVQVTLNVLAEFIGGAWVRG